MSPSEYVLWNQSRRAVLTHDARCPISVCTSVHVGPDLATTKDCQGHRPFIPYHVVEFAWNVEEPLLIVGLPEFEVEDWTFAHALPLSLLLRDHLLIQDTIEFVS